MDKVRFGIIGIGNIGTVHARYLLAGTVSDACLTAVCDNAPEKHPAIRQLVGNLPVFNDAQEMIQSGLIDAVIVATPHYEHPRLSMLAMRNGIHTLCEKPAGVYTAQVQEMNACARECDVVFGIMYNQRPNPLYQKVKDLIDSGELGEIRRSNWIITNWYRSQSYYNSGGWRATWKGEGAASCSTRIRISSISGSGWSACRSVCARFASSANIAISKWRTRSPPMRSTPMARRACLSLPSRKHRGPTAWKSLATTARWSSKRGNCATGGYVNPKPPSMPAGKTVW